MLLTIPSAGQRISCLASTFSRHVPQSLVARKQEWCRGEQVSSTPLPLKPLTSKPSGIAGKERMMVCTQIHTCTQPQIASGHCVEVLALHFCPHVSAASCGSARRRMSLGHSTCIRC